MDGNPQMISKVVVINYILTKEADPKKIVADVINLSKFVNKESESNVYIWFSSMERVSSHK